MKRSVLKKVNPIVHTHTVGIDLGDKFSHYCLLGKDGELLEEGRFRTTREGLGSDVEGLPKMRVAFETGTHSAWIGQLLTALGHEVIVANAGPISAITGSDKKTDANDAENLARFARFDPKLLHPITHRDKEKQIDLTVVRLRAKLVEVRTTLIITVRATVKSFGSRLPGCIADAFAYKCQPAVPDELRTMLKPFLDHIRDLTKAIKSYDDIVEEIATAKYPDAAILRTVPGVGPIASLTFAPHHRRQGPLWNKSGCRGLSWLTAEALSIRRLRSATSNHKGRRSLPSQNFGSMCPLHSRPSRT